MGDLVYVKCHCFVVCQIVRLFLIVSAIDAERKLLRPQLREIVFRPHNKRQNNYRLKFCDIHVLAALRFVTFGVSNAPRGTPLYRLRLA